MSALLRLEEKLELPQLRRESALLGPSPENDNAIQSPLASSENSHREIFPSPHLSLLEDKSAPQVNVAEKPNGLGQRASGVGITGKEEDVEVGLQYFGKRFLNPLLGRWISADPLAVHAPGEADLNLYAYVHGAVLKSVDPLGLAEEGSGGASALDENGGGMEGASSVDQSGTTQRNPQCLLSVRIHLASCVRARNLIQMDSIWSKMRAHSNMKS